MGGKKVFDGKPIDGILAKLFRTSGRKEQYKGKYKKLENAITSGKTIITSSGAKLVVVPKTSQNTANTSGRSASSSSTQKAKTTVMKVIPGKKGTGKNNNKVQGSGNAKVFGPGMNQQGPSENTHAQTKE